MSSLFADAMRAAIYCNASGLAPEPAAVAVACSSAALIALGRCAATLDWGDEFYCELRSGHTGDHIEHDEEDGIAWEMRWRPIS